MICKICGKNQFIGHQIIRADVLVDGDGEFAGNLSGGLEGHIYDFEKPYGPFTCICCGAEYDELKEDSYPVNFHERDTGVWIKEEVHERQNEEKGNLLVFAYFTSVWDGGSELQSTCTVNLITREVTEITPAKNANEECLRHLEREYVTIAGKDFEVIRQDAGDGGQAETCSGYWYRQ